MDTNEVSAERDALVSEQSSLEHQLTGRTTELTASSSGYFSEVVDGYESILTPSSLDEMTVEQFDKTVAQKPSAENSNSLGKIVKGFNWYLAAKIPAEQAERLQVGQELTVNFTQASMESKVTVHSINHQGDSDTALLVMEGTEFSSEMVSMREQPIEIIIATYTGLKVPKSAVRVQEQTDSDGKTTQIPGVFILSGSIQKFKMINELFEADDYYVVEQSATNSDMLVERDQVIVQGKNLQNNMVVKELQERVKSVIERVNNAAVQAGRDPSEITLVAATKMNDAERVQAAIEAGIRVCGENRVQELQEKYEQNAYDGADLQFIGTLQTNKVKYLIGKVSLIQSVGSVHLGEAIAKEAEKRGVCQDILLEVNIGREAAKSGLPPEELHDAIVKLSAKKSLHIRGLMAIPPVADEKTKNSNYFTEMRQVFIDILTKKYDNVDMDYLSMGMTNDFETAIACGANMVRVGTAIFGKRPYQIVSP